MSLKFGFLVASIVGYSILSFAENNVSKKKAGRNPSDVGGFYQCQFGPSEGHGEGPGIFQWLYISSANIRQDLAQGSCKLKTGTRDLVCATAATKEGQPFACGRDALAKIIDSE